LTSIRFAAAAVAISCAFGAACSALAQAYPSKPLRILVPLPAGSLTDRMARVVSGSVAQPLGQPIVVENRAGANGVVGMEVCARAPADGYTLCMPDGNIMTLNPFAYSKIPYDPMQFVPVIHFAELEQSIVVQSSLPVKNFNELLAYARARPGQVTWGSAGAGSTMHLYLEWVQAKTGVRFNHIPYKGPAELTQAMAAGEVAVTNLTTATVSPHVKAGKLRYIAIVAGKQRSQFAGDIPSFAEQGFELDFRNWLAFFFPPGTSTEYAKRWNGEINKLIADKAWVAKVTGAEAILLTGGTPEELAATLRAKSKVGAELAKIANLKYD
jgi:tripartite-type tricarboxylate transporter receptor subunit TctC